MRHATPHHRDPLATLRRSVASRHAAALTRRAFTLIELLVVIGIILLIAAITLSAVNLSISGDRVRGAARQTQSYLEGARSRAVYGGNMPAKGPGYQCGVRFIPELPSWRPSTTYQTGARVIPLYRGTGRVYSVSAGGGGTTGTNEPNWPTAIGNTVTDNGITWTCVADPILVSSVQYVELDPDNASVTGGTYEIGRIDDVNNTSGMPPRDGLADVPGSEIIILRSISGTNWLARHDAGLIFDFQTILLDNRKYQIRTTRLENGIEELILATPYAGTVTGASTDAAAVPSTSTPVYQLLLRPQPMSNQEPRSLGNGVVVDLSLSKGLSYFQSIPQAMDVMFSPRGTVVGPLSGTGSISLILSDREDSLRSIGLTGTSKRERLIVSLKPQTGMTAVHPVYIDPAGSITDPYRYSESGEVARQ